MSHGFVQQNSRPARPEHHFHFAGWRGHRAQLQNRARAASCAKCSGLFDPTNCSSQTCLRRLPSLRRHRAVFGDYENIQPAKRLRVAGKRAIRRRNQNPPQLLAVTARTCTTRLS